MNAKKLIKAIESSGHTAQSYSGRAMYGKKCIGVVISSNEEPTFLLKLAGEMISGAEDPEDSCFEVLDYLSKLEVRTDGMDLDLIMYFTNVSWPDSLEEEEEEDELY